LLALFTIGAFASLSRQHDDPLDSSPVVGNAVGIQKVVHAKHGDATPLYQALIDVIENRMISGALAIDVFNSQLDPTIITALEAVCRSSSANVTFLYEPLQTQAGSEATRCQIADSGCIDWVPYAPRNSPIYRDMRANPCLEPKKKWKDTSPVMLHSKQASSGQMSVVHTNVMQPNWGFFDIAFIFGPGGVTDSIFDVITLSAASNYDPTAVAAAVDAAAALGIAYNEPQCNRTVYTSELRRAIKTAQSEVVMFIKYYEDPNFNSWLISAAKNQPSVQFRFFVSSVIQTTDYTLLCQLYRLSNVQIGVGEYHNQKMPMYNRLHGTVLSFDAKRVAIGTAYLSERALDDPTETKKSREVVLFTEEPIAVDFITSVIADLGKSNGLNYQKFDHKDYC